MEFFVDFIDIFIVLLLLVLGYVFGRLAEWRHYKRILRREAEFAGLIVVTTKTLPPMTPDPDATLVRGSAVISVDYFKRFIANLRKIFGGRLKTYESLFDRARREAILRMQEEARALGATMIFNMRFETSSISKGRKDAVGTVEVLAYGTAIFGEGVAIVLER